MTEPGTRPEHDWSTMSDAADPTFDLRAFLDASPSPFHAARTAVERLIAAGFTEVELGGDWSHLPGSGFVVDGGSVVAWRHGDVGPDAPFLMAGAHTDSPCLRVKPNPDDGAAGWRQLNVEVYGGILNNSWLDRDLGIAGRLTLADGTPVLVDVREAIARVPQLAVHLDRGVNDNGLKLDAQQHLRPVWGVGAATRGGFARWIAERAGSDVPVFWDLCLYDVQAASVLGADRSLLASGRLDNQLSCWATVDALVAARPSSGVAVVVLNDHEEVGSSSTTGAAGPLLERVLERHVLARGGSRDDLLRALTASACVSADNAHAVHPNYVERHDPDHRPMVNAGPAIKINSNQRYATSSQTAAMFREACETAGVPHQVFVSRNNMPCGSTIGPITATRLGVATVDVGIPQLSMHSARELCGVSDPPALAAALRAFFDRV
jgi:aspartyl aminopeptidase